MIPICATIFRNFSSQDLKNPQSNTRWLECSCTGLAIAVLCYARAEPNNYGGHLQKRIMKIDAKTIDVKFVTCCLFFSSLQNILTCNYASNNNLKIIRSDYKQEEQNLRRGQLTFKRGICLL